MGFSNTITVTVCTWTKQSWKKRRSREAPIRGVLLMALDTTERTVDCSDGQLAS